ncbi:MAG: hypothetical protein M1819_002892 [Sarea resinae]|nr:MAG: hypothetical protein M1819_002892 [Sarea resinae]
MIITRFISLRASFTKRLLKWNTRQTSSTLTSDGPNSNDRYGVCDILAEKGISSVIWFEDLLALYGSDTQVWDLKLLVQDPREAANVLLHAGYKETSHQLHFDEDPESSKRGVRMAVTSSETGVMLLPTRDWYHTMDEESTRKYVPSLHSFIDSMIEFWLNISSRDYVDRVGFALYIGCLINYCYALKDENGEPVRDPAYANKLKPEHRELHYDIVADCPRKDSFTTTQQHQYHTRRSREIKEGLFTPQPHQKKDAFRAPLPPLIEH